MKIRTYNGLGKGNLLQKNKNRIKYVKKLSKNEVILEMYITEVLGLIENENTNDIIKHIGLLFYEKVPVRRVNKIIKIYTELNSKQINELKISIINNYKSKPENGFVWNMYHRFCEIYKTIQK